MRVTGALAATLLASLGGCGSDDGDGAGGSGNYVASCDAACAKAHDCDGSVDAATCTKLCQNDLAAIGPKLSGAYLAEIDACIREATCGELVANALFDTCGSRARAKLGASAAATGLCDRARTAGMECSRPTTGEAACVSGAKIFSDAALSAASACFERPCNDQAACVAAELGVGIGDLQ